MLYTWKAAFNIKRKMNARHSTRKRTGRKCQFCDNTDIVDGVPVAESETRQRYIVHFICAFQSITIVRCNKIDVEEVNKVK